MNKYNAFSLAEVLVTLIILGVIASITIPSLRKTSNERVYITGLLKAQSELTQATKTLKRTVGPISTWTDFSNAQNAKQQIIDVYKTVMPSVSTLTAAYDINPLNGTAQNNNESENQGGSSSKDDEDSEDEAMFTAIPNDSTTIVTADGMVYTLASVNNCTAANASSKNCFRVVVDVNGSKKPNMVGIDIYAFDVMKNSDVVPVMGACPPSGGSSDYGWGCTAKAIAEKNISW